MPSTMRGLTLLFLLMRLCASQQNHQMPQVNRRLKQHSTNPVRGLLFNANGNSPRPSFPQQADNRNPNINSRNPNINSRNPITFGDGPQNFPDRSDGSVSTGAGGGSVLDRTNPQGGGNSLGPRRPPSRKSFRTLDAPSCTNGPLDNLPCDADQEYSQDIVNLVENILISSRLNGILQNSPISQLLNDTGIVHEKVMNPGGGFSTRSGFITETPACSAQESIIYPQRAKTTADDWVFVLNQDSVKQGVRVEKCLKEGESCSSDLGVGPTVRTICRQKYIYRKVLVLSASGTAIQPESILIPSCCVCYIRRKHLSDSRQSKPRRNG